MGPLHKPVSYCEDCGIRDQRVGIRDRKGGIWDHSLGIRDQAMRLKVFEGSRISLYHFLGLGTKICHAFRIKDQKFGYKNGISDEKYTSLPP